MNKELLSVGEAAEYLDISRQSIHLAIKNKRLIPFKKVGSWNFFTKEELDNYTKTKYKRHITMVFNGKRVFDEEHYNLDQAAAFLGIKKSSMYYLIYLGKIPFIRAGSQYVFETKELQKILKEDDEMLKNLTA